METGNSVTPLPARCELEAVFESETITRTLTLIAILASCAFPATSNAQASASDAILVNGQIVTLDGRSSIVQAMAIKDGKMLAVGSDAEIRRDVNKQTRIIDFAGRTVIQSLFWWN